MKRIMIKYTAQIPEDLFDKWCSKYQIGRKEGTKWIKFAAEEAAEKQINDLVNDVNID